MLTPGVSKPFEFVFYRPPATSKAPGLPLTEKLKNARHSVLLDRTRLYSLDELLGFGSASTSHSIRLSLERFWRPESTL